MLHERDSATERVEFPFSNFLFTFFFSIHPRSLPAEVSDAVGDGDAAQFVRLVSSSGPPVSHP